MNIRNSQWAAFCVYGYTLWGVPYNYYVKIFEGGSKGSNCSQERFCEFFFTLIDPRNIHMNATKQLAMVTSPKFFVTKYLQELNSIDLPMLLASCDDLGKIFCSWLKHHEIWKSFPPRMFCHICMVYHDGIMHTIQTYKYIAEYLSIHTSLVCCNSPSIDSHNM